LFDWLVTGYIVQVNLAASVRGTRHVLRTGKTPVKPTQSIKSTGQTAHDSELKDDDVLPEAASTGPGASWIVRFCEPGVDSSAIGSDKAAGLHRVGGKYWLD
jgi:hypothetical protein